VRQTSHLLWTNFGVASKLHVMLDVLFLTAIFFVSVQKLSYKKFQYLHILLLFCCHHQNWKKIFHKLVVMVMHFSHLGASQVVLQCVLTKWQQIAFIILSFITGSTRNKFCAVL